MSRRRPLVLGIGNILAGDFGVGVEVVNALTQQWLPSDVTLLDGGTGGAHLLAYLRAHDPVILVHASVGAAPAGTVSVSYPRHAADFPAALATHVSGLGALIDGAAAPGPLPAFVLVAVSVDDTAAAGMQLSPPVRRAVGDAVETVLSALQVMAGHA